MKLSVVMPAHNEAGSIEEVLRLLYAALEADGIPHELLVVNDNSRDATEAVLTALEREIPTLRHVNNAPPNGFGLAVRKGLDNAEGDAVAVVMADGSDSPRDLVRFYRKMLEGYDCVFGSRFMAGSVVVDYPPHKKILNRLVNFQIRALFGLRYNDVTNAFKMYRSEVIRGLRPFLSNHFNLTVELPLKAIVRGYSYAVLPNSWHNRKAGESKLKLKEMGSRYLFIIIYCFIEKWLARKDYHKQEERA
ncbi:MAG: polyprenol phosphate mannosyl transferase 1 (Ppm1) [Fibrobacteria bacterium]|jgi:dolichol-phosphate mannosyltransferase|nr:polyprenol phosphate mannosyl transferase 1 (Ppm1) [Fibrobacteria bacterium]